MFRLMTVTIIRLITKIQGLSTKYITSGRNTTFIVLCFTICYTTTCFGPFLGHLQVVALRVMYPDDKYLSSGYITLKAKRIQPEDDLKKGRNM